MVFEATLGTSELADSLVVDQMDCALSRFCQASCRSWIYSTILRMNCDAQGYSAHVQIHSMQVDLCGCSEIIDLVYMHADHVGCGFLHVRFFARMLE